MSQEQAWTPLERLERTIVNLLRMQRGLVLYYPFERIRAEELEEARELLRQPNGRRTIMRRGHELQMLIEQYRETHGTLMEVHRQAQKGGTGR